MDCRFWIWFAFLSSALGLGLIESAKLEVGSGEMSFDKLRMTRGKYEVRYTIYEVRSAIYDIRGLLFV